MASFSGSLPLAKAALPLPLPLVPLGPAVQDALLGLQTHLCVKTLPETGEAWES